MTSSMPISFEGVLGLEMESKVRDPLHDTIPFTRAEKWVIDQPEFQRLRKIQQTAFIKYVFPGATHTRFEHSLGVMHLSGVFWNRLLHNQRKLLRNFEPATTVVSALIRDSYDLAACFHGSLAQTKEVLADLSNPMILQTLRFAGLLHDVGHAPFSHSAERFMCTWQELSTQLNHLSLKPYLREAIEKKIARFRSSAPKIMNQKIRHEIYTLMIVSQLFRKKEPFLDDEMGQNVCAVLDKDVAAAGVLHRSGLVTLLREIVSGELDVDRMDYLMRDSRECGVVYGLFDIGRLLDSSCFYFQPTTKTYHLAIRKSGIAAFEDYLRARWSMYQQVYFHKTSTACEAMLENINKQCVGYRLPLQVNAYLKLTDHSFPEVLKNELKKAMPQTTDENSENICDDLFDFRRLWKRIYEENTPLDSQTQPSQLSLAILDFLKSKSIRCEMIQSRTDLTRFSPKGRVSGAQNSLKVVVRDASGFSYLEQIENLSPLVNQTSDEGSILRIFVCLDSSNSNQTIRTLKAEIAQKIPFYAGASN